MSKAAAIRFISENRKAHGVHEATTRQSAWCSARSNECGRASIMKRTMPGSARSTSST